MSADAGGRVPVPSHEEELTRQWLAQKHRQVRPARPASAVVLVRDGEDGVEVLLRHRTGRTPLGRVGFPGGSLVEADAHPCPWFGPSPGEWARTLGLADRRRVRQHVVAAVRELFEECGVLLAGASDMEVVQDARGETWGARRSSLEHGDAGLPELLEERGLGLRTDLLRALGRWQSAPHSPRRFDTVVFTAALLDLADRFGRPAADGLLVAHDLTQEELAQLVGASRETVNKALAEFVQRGWIRLENRAVVVLDLQRLRQRSR